MTRLRKSCLLIGATFVLTLGFLTLIGWFLQIDVLVRLSHEFAAMTIGTAVCFIFSGLYISLYTITNFLIFNKIRFYLATLISLISCAYLAEHMFSLDLGIDFASVHQSMGSSGRPAINTMIGFLLFSISTIFLTSNRFLKKYIHFNKLHILISTSVILIGVIGLIGYFLNLREMYSWGGFHSMAINTSFGMTVLGISSALMSKDESVYSSEIDFEKKLLNLPS